MHVNPSNADLKRLFLTGYMGAGKSTVGRALANQLGFRFHDTDQMIVGRFKKNVAKIFEQEGEAAFRQAEIDILQELLNRSNVVVSTGGGTLTRPETLNLVYPQGCVIYLYAPVDVLYERAIFSRRERPLLNVPNSEQVFKERFDQREVFYKQSHLVIETVNKKPTLIAAEIIQALSLQTGSSLQ